MSDDDCWPTEDELKAIEEKERSEKLKKCQEIIDDFVKNDMRLSQQDLDRESDKFDEWMQSDSLKKFVEAAWEVFGNVDRNDRGIFVSWISAVEDSFDVESVSATTVSEAYLYDVTLHIRCKDGKLYDYCQRYDKAEFILFETFHDKKFDFFRRFFNSEAMRHLKEWAHEIRLEHPYNNWDRYRDMSKVPLSELPEPAKMDPDKFKRICDQLDKEAAENLTLKEAARRGNWNADTFKRQTGRGLFEF